MKKKICSIVLCLVFVLSLVTVFDASSVQTYTYSDPDWGTRTDNNVTADGLWMYEWYNRATGEFGTPVWDPNNNAGWRSSNNAQYSSYCRVRNNGNSLHPCPGEDPVKTFICPEAGTVRFQLSCQRHYAVSGNYDGSTVRLMQNDRVVWPVDGGEYELNDRSVAEIDVTLTVAKGDKLRFMVGCQQTSNSDLVNILSQTITYYNGSVSVNEVFSYADPHWGEGSNITADGLWRYEWFDRQTESFAMMDWNSGGYFEAQYTTANATDVHWYCRIRTGGSNLHPGAQADAVRTFVCPESGQVQLRVTCQRAQAVSGNNNGNTIRVMLNDTVVSADYNLDNTTVYNVDLTLNVQQGDLIRFMVGSQGQSSNDAVNVQSHSVKYLSGPNLAPELPSYTITCVGDSVTEGLTTTGGVKGPDAYPAVLSGLLNAATDQAKYTVNNCGKSSTTALESGDVPYVNSAEYATSLTTDPDIVLIGLGANDSKEKNWNAAQYRADYKELIQTYMNLDSNPDVYLIYTTYVADQSKTGCQRTVIQEEILPIQYEIAKELGLKIIDLNTLTKDNADKYNDGVHPNDELQSMMAEYVFNALCSEEVIGLSSDDATASVSMIDPNEELKSSEKELSVNYTGITSSGTVYSLDLLWENDDFSFDYVAGSIGTWNPDDHTYSGGSDAKWQDSDLLVTVVNHSNAAVQATLTVTDADPDDSLDVTVGGGVSKTETLPTAENTAVAEAPDVAFILTIEGVPTGPVEKVATATLSFAAAS